MEVLRKSLLTADFFTHSYRISGQVDTRGKRLSVLLNDRLTSYIELHRVFLSCLHKPSEIIATYSLAALRKEGVLFAILAVPDQALPERPTYQLFAQWRYEVFLTVPSFELRGQIESKARMELSSLLVKGGDFITLSKASAQTCSPPQISFSGELILVNKSWIELFCLTEASD